MRVMNACDTSPAASAPIVEFTLEHWLHFCQLYQRVKSFVVLAGVIRKHSGVATIAHNLVIVSEDTVRRLPSLHESALDSNVVDVVHLLHLVAAMVVMRGVMTSSKGDLGSLNVLIV